MLNKSNLKNDKIDIKYFKNLKDIYFFYFRSTKTIDRNYAMIEEMKSYINGEKEPEKGKKPIKPQDLVRLYDTGMFGLWSLRSRTDLFSFFF